MNERVIKGIVIDAGHGGEDPGAVNGNILEKDFNLLAAEYLYNRFQELGIPVAITRDTDVTLDRDTRVSKILNAFGDSSNVIVLSNHVNSGGGEGAEVVYALRNNSVLAKKVLEAIGQEGQVTRKYYQKRLPSDTSKDYYFIHRLTGNTTPLLIEYGFIDNPSDLNRLENNLEQYVEGVVRAVTQYAGYTYVAPSGVPSNVYVVKRGDTLFSIANEFGVTVNELKTANDLTSNLLNVGQTLVIPSIEPKPTTPENYIVYIVKAGDTLYGISKNYGVGVNEIIEFNQLPTTVLSVNQQLLIPTENVIEPIEQNMYTVVSGDSLWKIANKYNLTINDLIKSNNLTTTALQIGDVLIIPSSETIVEPIPLPTPETNEIKYTVKSGDSLYSVAKKYGITATELKEYNNLNTNLLSIGQVLLIPNTEDYITYYVQSGDNLYDIAKEYNTTVSEIKSVNGLLNNSLSIGQVLIIPS